jgi:hypothetical protein
MNFWIAIPTALMATLAEILPDIKPLRKLKERELIDDNLTVPLITALILVLLV